MIDDHDGVLSPAPSDIPLPIGAEPDSHPGDIPISVMDTITVKHEHVVVMM